MKIIITMDEAEKQELFARASRADDHYRSDEVYTNKVAHELLLATKHLYKDTVYAKAGEIDRKSTRLNSSH